MEIKGFIETSLVDWDGMVCCVLFLPGCNFRCPFCYNHLLVKHPEQLESVPWDRVERYLEQKRDWIDGVVITGGEPTIHQELRKLLGEIQNLKFQIKLDTNGYRPDVLAALFQEKLVNYVAMDIKAPLDVSYSRAAGVKVDIALIARSIELIMNSGLPYEFRTTVVPGFHTVASMESIGQAIQGAKKWALQQFLPAQADDPDLRTVRPLAESAVEEMRRRGSTYVERCLVRGLRQVAEAPPN